MHKKHTYAVTDLLVYTRGKGSLTTTTVTLLGTSWASSDIRTSAFNFICADLYHVLTQRETS